MGAPSGSITGADGAVPCWSGLVWSPLTPTDTVAAETIETSAVIDKSGLTDQLKLYIIPLN